MCVYTFFFIQFFCKSFLLFIGSHREKKLLWIYVFSTKKIGFFHLLQDGSPFETLKISKNIKILNETEVFSNKFYEKFIFRKKLYPKIKTYKYLFGHRIIP